MLKSDMMTSFNDFSVKRNKLKYISKWICSTRTYGPWKCIFFFFNYSSFFKVTVLQMECAFCSYNSFYYKLEKSVIYNSGTAG